MPSKVDLCNTALRRLGQEPIIALDNNTIWGRRCNQALPQVVDEVLRMDVWRSCVKRARLAASTETPIGFKNKFRVPSDYLRLAAVKIGRYETWSFEGKYILTNGDGPLDIMYVAQVTDPNDYDSSLYTALCWRLAVELSGYSTTSTVRKDETYQAYVEALSMAMNVNSRENPVAMLDPTTWIDARHSNLDRGLYGDSFYEVG